MLVVVSLAVLISYWNAIDPVDIVIVPAVPNTAVVTDNPVYSDVTTEPIVHEHVIISLFRNTVFVRLHS
jgi:hypothetical protein